MATLQEFLEQANNCYVKKNSLLASAFKTGYPDYTQLLTEISIMGMYLYVLPRLGNDYALTGEQVDKILHHILKLCRRVDVALPVGAGVITGTPIGGQTIIIIGETIIVQPRVYTMNYSGVESFTVSVPHALNKWSPTVVVTDTSGSTRVRVYPSITEVDENNLTLEFNSTSSGIITVM